MGNKVDLITDQDPCDPPADSVGKCKCELVCKCMKYNTGKTYQTSTEKCDDYLKGIPEKCKNYKKCRKEAKRRLYEICEQYKNGKKKKKKEKPFECCCLKTSKYEDELNDKMDKKCGKYKEDKKSESLIVLDCNCIKPNKNEEASKLNKKCRKQKNVESETDEEDEETTESDEEEQVCKTKKERKIDKDYRKGKISKRCKKELKTEEYKNQKKEESRCKKNLKDPCIKCDDAYTNISYINASKQSKKNKKNKTLEHVCDKTCVKYKKDEKEELTSGTESASISDSEKGKKAKKTKKNTKKDKACERKKLIEEFEKLEEEKRALECAVDSEMEEYFKNDPLEEEPRYLLPDEYKKLSKEEKCKREKLIKEYLKKGPKPYRCVRTCIDPETAKLKYQEYICYPPPPCVPALCEHPPISFPKECRCENCSDYTCASQVCRNIRLLKEKIKYQEPEKCDPITVCVPVSDGRPPIICADCPLEIREKELDFHIVDHRNIKKHIKMMNIKLKKVIEEWEKQNLERKLNVHRFC